MENIEERLTVTDSPYDVIIPKTSNAKEFLTFENPRGVDLYELERNRTEPPKRPTDQELDKNRAQGRIGGAYQTAIRAERIALREGLKKYSKDLSLTLTSDEIDRLINYLPNARFAYLNKLIKAVFANGTIKQGDLDAVSAIWMSRETFDLLTKLFSVLKVDQTTGFTVQPTPPRGGIAFTDAPGKRMAIPLKNPGFLVPKYSENNDVQYAEEILQHIGERIEQIKDELDMFEDTRDVYSSDMMGNNSLSKTLLYFREKLLDKHISYKELTKMSEALSQILKVKQSKYLLALANPFKHRTARIPTLISPPSATFSIRSMATLTTNALGNVAFVYNPWYLSPLAGSSSSFGINNNATLTGAAASDFFLTVDIGQSLPANFYVRYRLVSAGIRVYVYPSSNNDNGILTVSTTFENLANSPVPLAVVNSGQFAFFNEIENGYFKQTTTIASRMVQEHTYIPVDDSFYDYQTLNTIKSGFGWTGYITGAAVSTSVARVEITANYEALVDNAYTDYLPTDSPMEEMDPKMIFGAVSKVKNNIENTSTQSMEKALSELNQSTITSESGTITLPTTQKMVVEKQNHLSDLVDIGKQIVKKTLENKPNLEKTNIFERIMNAISPIAAQLISNVARSYNPFSFIK